MQNSWGAIFDWDGVVIDSARQHEAAWHLLARKEGLVVPPNVFKRSFGMRNENVIPDLLRWSADPAEIQRLSLAKEQCYRELALAEGAGTLPGVMPFLEMLKQAGIPCAIDSSGPTLNIQTLLRHLKLEPFFQAAVCGEDVRQGKPHPEVFLRAAERLGLAPAHCVVFEDAHVGIQAARAAGMRVVGVATTHPGDTLEGCDIVVNRLDQLVVPELSRWFASS